MESEVIKIIKLVKEIVYLYPKENVYKEKEYDNENVLYYSVVLWGIDEKMDLAFYIEYYKQTKSILPIICNTRHCILYETVKISGVIEALKQLKKAVLNN